LVEVEVLSEILQELAMLAILNQDKANLERYYVGVVSVLVERSLRR